MKTRGHFFVDGTLQIGHALHHEFQFVPLRDLTNYYSN